MYVYWFGRGEATSQSVFLQRKFGPHLEHFGLFLVLIHFYWQWDRYCQLEGKKRESQL